METSGLLDLSLNDFLRESSLLEYSDRIKLLEFDEVIEKIFLLDKHQNAWDFQKVLKVYKACDLLKKMNSNIIEKIKELYKGYEYVFLACLKRMDQVYFEESLKSNSDLLKLLLYKGEAFYSELDFSYDTLIYIIKYMYSNQIDVKNTCISSILLLSLKDKREEQRMFLEENIPNSFKKLALLDVDPDLLENFLNKNIVSLTEKEINKLLLYSEVSIEPSLYENKEFFKKIIFSSSIYEMREILTRLASRVDPSYFENLISKMEDNILEYYKKNKNLKNFDNDTLASEFVKMQFLSNKSIEEITKKIVLMVIVDKLFQDSIRNVLLNIEELLSFKENNLSKEKLEFYKEVMNLFLMDPDSIIRFYDKYKDSYLVSNYYDDVRSAKDCSYQKIKDACFKIEEHESLKNKNLSSQYGVDVYELNGEDFVMLVTCRSRIPSGNNLAARNCYSLIGSYNMHVFNENNYIYGFTNFDINKIMHVLEDDSYSLNQPVNTTNFVNRIRSISDILSSNRMNEIQIKNLRVEGDNAYSYRYERLLPSYIVCFDSIRDKDLNAAKTLNIPIILINRKKYKEKDEVILENYNEKYTTSFYDEMKYQDKFL